MLLAGDAAHACNPCGGLGLTGGVIDADNLSDALGAVIAGRARRERARLLLAGAPPGVPRGDLADVDQLQAAAVGERPGAARRGQGGDVREAGHGHADVRASSLAELIKGAAMPIEPIAAMNRRDALARLAAGAALPYLAGRTRPHRPGPTTA